MSKLDDLFEKYEAKKNKQIATAKKERKPPMMLETVKGVFIDIVDRVIRQYYESIIDRGYKSERILSIDVVHPSVTLKMFTENRDTGERRTSELTFYYPERGDEVIVSIIIAELELDVGESTNKSFQINEIDRELVERQVLAFIEKVLDRS